MGIEVVPISPDTEDWAGLIGRSKQATLYVMPEWLRLHPVHVLAAYRGTEIAGGIVAAAQGARPLPYVPYQGMLLIRQKTDAEIMTALIEAVEAQEKPVSVWNAPSLVDVRPFNWRLWDAHVMWNPSIRYTYLCDKNSKLEPRARAQVTGKLVTKVEDEKWFEDWRAQTWVHESDVRMMQKILKLESVSVFEDEDAQVVWGVDHNGRGYYLGSVGPPTNVLVHLLGEHESVDLVGCNSPERALFKRSFGGQLRTSYGMWLA